MSDVYEIYDYKWDSKTEIMYIEAEVSDSILACRATQYEPEQWKKVVDKSHLHS